METVKESVAMHNSKRELLRCFNTPELAIGHLTLLNALALAGMGKGAKAFILDGALTDDYLVAINWLNDVLGQMHKINALEAGGDCFHPGDLIPE